MLIPAIVLITAALLLYTAGVWGERRSGTLRPLHVALFAGGFLCDAGGTWLMSQIAGSGTYTTTGAASVLTTLMAVTGGLALILMGIHLAWAIGVLAKGSPAARATFHRFSVLVWAIWLVPYFTGMASAMIR
ncbi:TIGR03987 family protein [Propioniciclava coleopterorum]|uniref:TIGR03987 family protein n=1 Tax=Propioniciclava coleopterorum TaxID=2714937 RepID=A0A6G7Y9T6_9ACTN|nr:HsmA family protein [Propioniciclava coleopterorum]QIK73582.1 TIGR03987 family protein [Propioniciclava coleopterorum]